MNCDFITARHKNTESGSCVVCVRLENKLSLQELKQSIVVKLLTSGFLGMFGSWS